MTKKKVTAKDSIKINPKNPRPAIVTYGKEVGKKIDKAMKEHGWIQYMETIGNDQVSYFRYYKHPHKIAKLCFSVVSEFNVIETEFGTDEEYRITEIHLSMSIDRPVLETPMHKDMTGSPYSGQLKTFHIEFLETDRIPTKTIISVKPVFEDLFDDVGLMDNDTISEWEEAIRRQGIEAVFGQFGRNHSDFASIEDARQFFMENWTDGEAAIMEFGFEELYPETVKDMFLF
jgi:hypothetical protein